MPQSPGSPSPPPDDRLLPGSEENAAAPARARFFSLRLLGLVALMLVPWLILVVYTQVDERKAAIAHVNGVSAAQILAKLNNLLNADGMLLGIRRDVDLSEVKVKLLAGDVVVFYTDGITEVQNAAGEMFGVESLSQVVTTYRAEDPETLVAGVLAALDGFAGATQREDDLTIVAMQLTT